MNYENTLMHKKYLAILLFPLLLMNLLKLTQFPNEIREIADITSKLTLYISLISLIIYAFYNRNRLLPLFNQNLTIYLSLIGFSLVYLISHIINQNFFEDTTLLTLYLTLGLIVLIINVEWRPEHLTIMAYLSSFVVLFFFLDWYLSDFPMDKFKSITRNPNGLGIILFCLLFFKIIALNYLNLWNKLFIMSFILMNLIILYATTSRSVFLALFTALFSWIIIKLLPKLANYLFILVLSLMGLFVFLYIKLLGTSISKVLNDISISIFNKSFFSGRSELWNELWTYGVNSPIIGHGIGVKVNEVTSSNLSAHNQFLQIFIETGLIGLLIFTLLLFFIWRKLFQNINTSVGAWSASFLLAIIVYQNLEVNLLINNPSLNFLQWLIICIGINFKSQKILKKS